VLDISFLSCCGDGPGFCRRADFFKNSAQMVFSTDNPWLEKVSYTLGKSWWSTFKKVTLPWLSLLPLFPGHHGLGQGVGENLARP
jgi:hypothetical protein